MRLEYVIIVVYVILICICNFCEVMGELIFLLFYIVIYINGKSI